MRPRWNERAICIVQHCRCERFVARFVVRFVFSGFYFASLGSSGFMPTIFVFTVASVQRCSRTRVENVSISNVVRISDRGQNRTKNIQGRKICQGAMDYQGGKHQKGPCSFCWKCLLMLTAALQHGTYHMAPCRPTHFTPLSDWDASVLFCIWVDLRWVLTPCKLLIALARHNSRHCSSRLLQVTSFVASVLQVGQDKACIK